MDWDALELAMTWRSEEAEYFLDLHTGEVHLCRLDRLGGQQEDDELSEEDADDGLAEGHLVRVEPLPSSVEYDWMAEFTATVKDSHLRDLLEVALGGRGAFRRLKDVLAEYPRERERWFASHDQRVREAMLKWLDDHDIEPTTPPPERKG